MYFSDVGMNEPYDGGRTQGIDGPVEWQTTALKISRLNLIRDRRILMRLVRARKQPRAGTRYQRTS